MRALLDQRKADAGDRGAPSHADSQGGGKYDWNHLESVCGDCQAEAHGARPKIRIDARTGLPLPGQDHPWSDRE